MKLGVLRMSFVDMNKFENHLELETSMYVGSLDTLFNYLVAWWLVHGGFNVTWDVCYSLCGGVQQPMGFNPPQSRRLFPWFLMHLSLVFWPFVFKKIQLCIEIWFIS
jgi:hypothetical protein